MKNNSVNKRYVPKLRFKGFEENWIQSDLQSLETNKYKIENSNLFLDAKAITKQNYLLWNGEIHKNAPGDSIIFIKDGSNCGTYFYSKNSVKIASTCEYLKFLYSNDFFFHLLDKNKKNIRNSLITGNAIPHIYKKNLLSLHFEFSANELEREKISKFLNLLDKQISLLENKLKLTEQLKNYYLKNLFTNEKNNIPKLRFKDFVDKLVIDKFSNLVLFARSGGTPKSGEHKYYQNGTIPFLSINDLNQKYLSSCSKKITNLAIEETSTFIFEKNNILLSIYATIGEVAINKIDVALPQSILGIKIKKNIGLEYFYYLLLFNKGKLIKYSQTGSQPNLSLKIINNIKLNLTIIRNEQYKISHFLSLIDNSKEKVQNKINLLKMKKVYFLNKLFI